jgi:hypothetical protein
MNNKPYSSYYSQQIPYNFSPIPSPYPNYHAPAHLSNNLNSAPLLSNTATHTNINSNNYLSYHSNYNSYNSSSLGSIGQDGLRVLSSTSSSNTHNNTNNIPLLIYPTNSHSNLSHSRPNHSHPYHNKPNNHRPSSHSISQSSSNFRQRSDQLHSRLNKFNQSNGQNQSNSSQPLHSSLFSSKISKTPKKDEVMDKEREDEIATWIEERKRKFPTRANLEKKKTEEIEKRIKGALGSDEYLNDNNSPSPSSTSHSNVFSNINENLTEDEHQLTPLSHEQTKQILTSIQFLVNNHSKLLEF